jgi:copper oxidase (laccase) domain-containing protein
LTIISVGMQSSDTDSILTVRVVGMQSADCIPAVMPDHDGNDVIRDVIIYFTIGVHG